MTDHLIPFLRRLGPLAFLVAWSCATTQPWKSPAAQDTGDVPATLRPGFGNAELGTWWPLNGAEVTALKRVEQARQGDARALLALAILASGERRDDAAYAAFQRRIDQFVAEVGPTIAAAPDEWHRGYELHRAMHRLFFSGRGADLGGYVTEQARVTGILSSGRYNCLSSAMLFTVLARAFDLPVRAVFVPTHVFVEMGAPGARAVEIETTSATGYGWVHDERFFREGAATWSGQRGLRPVTMDDYRMRTIVQPYQLMATAMRDTHVAATEQDRDRLFELSGVIDPSDGDALKGRVQTYALDAQALYNAKASRTSVKLFEIVGPTLSRIATTTRDAKLLELVSWLRWYQAHALLVVGRQAEAMALMDDGLAHVDPAWDDATKLRTNYLSILNDVLCDLIDKKLNVAALQLLNGRSQACLSHEVCASNAGVIYGNVSIEYSNAGDWPASRRVLRECVAVLPNDRRCRDLLTDLESRHQF